MASRKDSDYGYFRDDESVSLGDEKPSKPLLLRAYIVGPLLAMTVVIVFSIVIMNVVKPF